MAAEREDPEFALLSQTFALGKCLPTSELIIACVRATKSVEVTRDRSQQLDYNSQCDQAITSLGLEPNRCSICLHHFALYTPEQLQGYLGAIHHEPSTRLFHDSFPATTPQDCGRMVVICCALVGRMDGTVVGVAFYMKHIDCAGVEIPNHLDASAMLSLDQNGNETVKWMVEKMQKFVPQMDRTPRRPTTRQLPNIPCSMCAEKTTTPCRCTLCKDLIFCKTCFLRHQETHKKASSAHLASEDALWQTFCEQDMAIGCLVSLQNLQKAAHLNGCVGVLYGKRGERYVVILAQKPDGVAIPPENLKFVSSRLACCGTLPLKISALVHLVYNILCMIYNTTQYVGEQSAREPLASSLLVSVLRDQSCLAYPMEGRIFNANDGNYVDHTWVVVPDEEIIDVEQFRVGKQPASTYYIDLCRQRYQPMADVVFQHC